MLKDEFYSILDYKSLKNIPFFFMIDFLQKKFLVKNLTDIIFSRDILIDFPLFSNINKTNNYNENYNIKTIKIKPKIINKSIFDEQFNKVHHEIKIGNSYLTNLTFDILLQNQEKLKDFFYSSYSKYKLFINNHFVCFSPETFIKIINNYIFTYPMKGTIDASIKNAKIKLLTNKKEKAEHITVVDLLRNDLSIVSMNVNIKKFRYVENIRSNNKNILQTSSKIQGKIITKYKNKIGSILKKMLPAGSISGAPKKKTIEIINSIESHKRGYYTGVAGVFDGNILDTCILIRFIENRKNKLFYKTGCGIHYLSNKNNEFKEIKNKIYVPIF